MSWAATASSRQRLPSALEVAQACPILYLPGASFELREFAGFVELYEILERHAPSPLNTLNRAIALAELYGPAAGLDVLRALKPPAWLAGYYLWDATIGELERRSGKESAARFHLQRALERAPHPAERMLIEERLADCAPVA